MKITIEIEGHIDGVLADKDKLVEAILRQTPGMIISKDVDGTEDWAFLFDSANGEVTEE